jgi:REP element-mobilizing transposase RayT
MSTTQILYHIILRTKRSERTLVQQNISSLYKYIWGIIQNKKCVLYRIN